MNWTIFTLYEYCPNLVQLKHTCAEFFFFFLFLFIAIQRTLLTKQDKNTDNTTNNTTKIRYVNYLLHGTSLQYTTFTFFFITHLANNNPLIKIIGAGELNVSCCFFFFTIYSFNLS